MFLTLTGIISGIVSGLGMGGGTILIIILTNFFEFNQHTAQASNILFFIPTSIAAILVHLKEKDLEKKIILKMTPIAAVGGALGAYISARIPSENLRMYFGIFLLLIGMYEIVILVKNKIQENEEIKNNMKRFLGEIFRKKKKTKGE
ncbi:MAG: sulfite exporter TauE/SafE family protein [Clostridia bacterium]|nr:sulfite exporter TauE/SafE family protein [Clostridia bacterium]